MREFAYVATTLLDSWLRGKNTTSTKNSLRVAARGLLVFAIKDELHLVSIEEASTLRWCCDMLNLQSAESETIQKVVQLLRIFNGGFAFPL